MATSKASQQLHQPLITKQQTSPASGAWTDFPLEIRQNIIRHYLTSCWIDRSGTRYGLVSSWLELRHHELAVLANVAHSFGQQDVLQPLSLMRTSICGEKDSYDKESNAVGPLHGLSSEEKTIELNREFRARYASEVLEVQLGLVDQVIGKLEGQQVWKRDQFNRMQY